MKQKYVCKCGKVFEKESSADTTGYRLGEDFGPDHECYGCPFVVSVTGPANMQIINHECRASKTIRYDTTADLPRAREGFHVGRIYTLDLDFAREIWEYSRGLPGLETSAKEMDKRGACFEADGRYCLTLYLQKTRDGIASAVKISEKFFAGSSTRPGITADQEKKIVLQLIRRSIEDEKRPILNVPAEGPQAVSSRGQGPRNIEQITLEINFYKQQTAQNILEIGKRLIEAKQQFQHGEWLPWLRDQVQFTERSAQNFMRIAEEFSKTKPVADLPYTKLLALLQVPEEDREEFIQETHLVGGREKTIADMSKRELEQAIKERDESKEKAKSLEEENAVNLDHYLRTKDSLKEISDALQNARKESKQLQDQRSAAEKATKEALGRISDLEKQIEELESRPIDVAVQEPGEDVKERLREEGADSARRQYEQQLLDARRKLEAAKSQVRREIGLQQDDIITATATFRDSLDSICDNFQLILRLLPASSIESVVQECIDHMRGLIHEMEDTAARVKNASLMDQDFSLPPEDGKEN